MLEPQTAAGLRFASVALCQGFAEFFSAGDAEFFVDVLEPVFDGADRE
jgi:hypothetical protein